MSLYKLVHGVAPSGRYGWSNQRHLTESCDAFHSDPLVAATPRCAQSCSICWFPAASDTPSPLIRSRRRTPEARPSRAAFGSCCSRRCPRKSAIGGHADTSGAPSPSTNAECRLRRRRLCHGRSRRSPSRRCGRHRTRRRNGFTEILVQEIVNLDALRSPARLIFAADRRR